MKRLEKLKKVVYVVDMVNGFLKEGNMKNPEAMRIVKDICLLLDKQAHEEEGIAFIKDTHSEDSSEFKKFPVHCVKGTTESMVIDELVGYETDALSYEKNSTCVCAVPEFFKDIDSMLSLEEVTFVGVCTDICVLNAAIGTANYMDEHNRVIKINVPENMIDTFDSEGHNKNEYTSMALKLMKQSGIDTREM